MPPDIQVTITPVVAGPTVVISPVVSGPALVISEGVQGLTGPQGVQGPVGAASTVPGPQGIKGDPGERGDRGIQGEVGPAPWRLVGPYDNGMDYGLGDAVTYQGGFYYRTGNPLNPGYPPEPGVINASWTPVADRGAVGPQGVPGQNGSDASVTSVNITTALGYTPDNPSAARTPTAHTHTKSQITDFTHAHAITDVTGLQTALDGKTPTAHTHTKSQITDFTHAHAITDVTGLQTALDGKTPTAHTHTKSQITDFPTLATVATSGSYADLSSKPTIPAAQVNSDWNASSGVAQILNKPSLTQFQPNPDAPVDTTVTSFRVVYGSGYVDTFRSSTNSAFNNYVNDGYSAEIIFNGTIWQLINTVGDEPYVEFASSDGPAYPWRATWTGITVTTNFDQIVGKPLEVTGSTGTSNYAARADHVHPRPTASQITGLATVATTGSYTSLSNKPSIPSSNQSLNTSDNVVFNNVRADDALEVRHFDTSIGDEGGYVGVMAVNAGGISFEKPVTFYNPTIIAGDSDLIVNATNFNLYGRQFIFAAANTSALTASYSVTGANTTPLLNLSGTWNTTGVARGILLNITDTASAASSRLLDLQVGGTSRFVVRKDGVVSLNSGDHVSATGIGLSTGGLGNAMQTSVNGSGRFLVAANRVNLPSASSFGWVSGTGLQSAADTILARDAANTLAQRNGTNAQTFRLYNTFTDASNYERGFMRWNSNTLEIGTEAGGTGASRVTKIISAAQVDVFTFGTVQAARFSSGSSIIYNALNFGGVTLAANPTTTDLNAGRAGVWKNSTSGVVSLWYNDGGTMKSIALA